MQNNENPSYSCTLLLLLCHKTKIIKTRITIHSFWHNLGRLPYSLSHNTYNVCNATSMTIIAIQHLGYFKLQNLVLSLQEHFFNLFFLFCHWTDKKALNWLSEYLDSLLCTSLFWHSYSRAMAICIEWNPVTNCWRMKTEVTHLKTIAVISL